MAVGLAEVPVPTTAGRPQRAPKHVPPNQRLQRARARGSRVEWLESAIEVGQVLCGWRAVARR
jgi:hypothetical protein